MNNDCPNILPIKTPLQDYIYDVNLNTFVPVPQDVFQYAEKRLKNKNGTIEEKRKFDAMMEKGYFSSEHIKRINNPYSNYLPLLLSRNMSQILLQVTQGCNFRCEYCIYTASIDGIQRKHTNKRMDFHTAKHAVDYLWNHSIDSDVVTIGFYGGEPLLEFELIKQVILYRDPLRLLAMGYTNREIAESLGLTDEVVRMRLFRGRQRLWKELDSHE